jgi:hypothetical protein
MNADTPAALIGLTSALIVAIFNIINQKKEFNRQQEILTRIEAIKLRDLERNKTLKITRERIIEAASGAESLAQSLSISGRNIVKDAAEAFKSAGTFFQHATEALNGWDLKKDEKDICKEFEKSLTEFFLSLDLDCNFQKDQEYESNITQRINRIT